MLHSIFVWTAKIGLAIFAFAVIGGFFWVWSDNGRHYGGIVEFYISACAAALGLSLLVVGLVGGFFS